MVTVSDETENFIQSLQKLRNNYVYTVRNSSVKLKFINLLVYWIIKNFKILFKKF